MFHPGVTLAPFEGFVGPPAGLFFEMFHPEVALALEPPLSVGVCIVGVRVFN
jgi:hypothetical protein